MLKKRLLNFKSNKGFTIYDLIVAIIIFTMFAGIIGSLIVSTYKLQINTQIENVVTLYTVQIAEYIDKISFEEVNSELSSILIQEFNIPDQINLEIEVSDYNPNQEAEVYIKQVSINLIYDLAEEQKNILINRLKIKEL